MASAKRHGLQLRVQEFESQPGVPLRFYVLEPADAPAKRVVLSVLQDQPKELAIRQSGNRWPGAFHFDTWSRMMRAGFPDEFGLEASGEPDTKAFADLQKFFKDSPSRIVFFAPRGIGPNRWHQPDRKQVQIRRRFMLLGQTLDGMHVWDIRGAIQAVQKTNELPLWIEANIARIALSDVPSSHMDTSVDYLNVMRVLDIPQTVALAAERIPLQIEGHRRERWSFVRKLAENLGWPREQFVIVRPEL